MIGTFYNEEFKAQRSSLIYLRLQAQDMGQRHDLRVFPDCKSHPLPTTLQVPLIYWGIRWLWV